MRATRPGTSGSSTAHPTGPISWHWRWTRSATSGPGAFRSSGASAPCWNDFASPFPNRAGRPSGPNWRSSARPSNGRSWTRRIAGGPWRRTTRGSAGRGNWAPEAETGPGRSRCRTPPRRIHPPFGRPDPTLGGFEDLAHCPADVRLDRSRLALLGIEVVTEVQEPRDDTLHQQPDARSELLAFVLGGEGRGDRPAPLVPEHDEQRRPKVRPGVLQARGDLG